MSPKPSKYRNVPTIVDGVRFASKLEAKRWGELVLLQRAGHIQGLRRQPRYSIHVGAALVCTYVGDADYLEVQSGKYVVEDCKSPASITAVYKLKRALMKAVYGIEIREIMK